MSRRQRANLRRRSVGRGIHTECPALLNAQARSEGFDIEIPDFVRTMFNDWEDELSGSLATAGRTPEHRRNH